jgi:DNA-binding winged helix-turn-helix (wHTH) protein
MMLGNLPPFTAAQQLGAALNLAHPCARSVPAGSAATRDRGSLRFGRCEVRVGCREVLVDGHPRPLQPLPFNLLLHLIEHRSRVVTIDELLDAVWGDACVQQGSLPAAVMRVRKALSVDGTLADDVIRTYSRIGYRFVAPVEGDRPEGESPS